MISVQYILSDILSTTVDDMARRLDELEASLTVGEDAAATATATAKSWVEMNNSKQREKKKNGLQDLEYYLCFCFEPDHFKNPLAFNPSFSLTH